MFNKEEIFILEEKKKEIEEYFKFLNNKDLNITEKISKYCEFYNKDFIKGFNLNNAVVEKINNLLNGIDIVSEKKKSNFRK